MSSYYEKFLATGEVKCIDEEIPFEIPISWKWCRISDVCVMQAGKNITADKIFSEPTEAHPYRCVGGNGLRGYVAEFNTEGNHAIVGRQGALCGCLNVEVGNFYATEHAVVVSSYGNIHYKFMYWFLMALNLNQLATATAQPGLSVAKVMDSYFPLPPLPEQQRIITKIEELMPFVNKFDKAQISLNILNSSMNELLKKSILQQAIQGKLVEQCGGDEPASELLNQIKAEKKRLVKEGKLKKSALTDSVIFKGDDNKYWEKVGKEVRCIDVEIPFEIPDTWQWVRIKDVFEINPKNIAEDYCISAFIPMEKICATYGSEFSYDEVQWKTIKSGYTHFANGDVAFAKITPCFQNRKSVILCNLPNGIGAGTTELKVLRQFGETINRWYLLFFLKSPYFIDEATFKGTANQQRITSGYLENKLFPLPPLHEQNRIVQKIKAIASIMSRQIVK